MSADIVTVTQGSGPLILSMPHPGTGLPAEVHAALNATGRAVPDTDWHMRELYAFTERFEPTIVEAGLSRYVIDLNRDPSGVSLYPGQATTELVPTTTFDGEPIWATPPDAARSSAGASLFPALSRRAFSRDRAGEGAAWLVPALGLSFDQIGDSAPVSRHAADAQSRHQFGRE
jgi:N-formylglutamate amidohydrolase